MFWSSIYHFLIVLSRPNRDLQKVITRVVSVEVLDTKLNVLESPVSEVKILGLPGVDEIVSVLGS